jgi:NIMA (never in mitosis gene a)-related kinase
MSLQEFTIIKELGSGSFGNVFKVKKKSDKKFYAMKQVKLSNLNQK